MPQKSLRQVRADLRRLSTDRFVDALLVVCTPDGEEILRAGGRWDCLAHRYVGGATVEPHVVYIKRSQIPAARGLASWFEATRRDDPERPIVLMCAGARGSGKTWLLAGIALVAIGLEFPNEYQFAVNLTAPQRRECIESMQEVAQPDWIGMQVEDARFPLTRLITGSTILWLSAKNPKKLRQAKLTIRHVLINEAQDMPEVVYVNALSASRNVDGLTTIATNRPQTEGNDWVSIAAQSIESGETPGLYYLLDPRLNDAVSKVSLDKRARAIRAVSPAAAAADADPEGGMPLSGDVGYPGFSSVPYRVDAPKSGHVGGPPDIAPPGRAWEDVTRELTARAYGGSVGFDYVAGCDFQRTPGTCATTAKLYRRPDDGLIVLCCYEFVATTGGEEDLSQALISRGYYPGSTDVSGNRVASILLVGDATSSRNNVERNRGKPYSFVQLGNDGWKVMPPMKHWKHGTPWNPPVLDSRKQMHALFVAHQILFAPKCAEQQPGFPSLVEGFRRTKVHSDGTFVKRGHYTHGPDGVRYMAWAFLPRPQPPVPGGGYNRDAYNTFRRVRMLGDGE